MSNNTTTIEPLIKSVEIFCQTSTRLYKLYIIDVIAEFISAIYARLIVVVIVCIAFLFFSIGLSIWLGDLIGKIYWGFFIIAGSYLFIALLLSIFKEKWAINPIYNSVARKLKK